jgi:DNA primase
VDFPSGRHADELCVTELASVIWAVQMSTVEFHPWNSRRADVESPDEWRIDIDPMPECSFDSVRRVAGVAHEVLDEIGAVGWPKTSVGAGIHIYVRIEPRWGFADVRRAALAFAREVERRAPADAPKRFARLGDLHAGIDEQSFSLEPLLDWAARDERDRLVDPGAPE